MTVVKIEDPEGLTCDGREDCGSDVRVAVLTEYSDALKLCYDCAKKLHHELEDKL